LIPSLYTSAVGFSKSERYLAELAQGTFLSLWSHPNLFRSRSKELADLIVIFGDEIIVFSDKSCEYKEGEHGWTRWYRRAVLDSAKQLHRAAGWLRKHPNEIYMDAKCERRFPLHIPRKPSLHLVAVATGAHDAAIRHIGGNGSLAIETDADGSEPFVIGDLDPLNDFVHIFDNASLSSVLRERDTVADFVTYLRKRAAFLRSGPVISAPGGELDLLAHYLRGMHGREHDFVVPQQDKPPTHIMLDGDWSTFETSGPYLRKKAADAESYVWDRIIEEVTKHADAGTLVTGQEHGLSGTEELLRFFASEDRFARRLLATNLHKVRKLAVGEGENVRVRTSRDGYRDDRAYVFLVARRESSDENGYREFRRGLVAAHTIITKLRYPDVRTIVGVAVAPADDPDGSVDLVVRTYTEWTDEDRQKAETLRAKLGWAQDIADLEKHWHHDEYPAAAFTPPKSAKPRSRHMKAQTKEKRRAQRAARKKSRR
jgi:hypothetical protein